MLKKNLLSGVKGYYDCVIVNGGVSSTGGKLLGKNVNNFCGLAGLATKTTVVVTANAAIAGKMATLCSKYIPIQKLQTIHTVILPD